MGPGYAQFLGRGTQKLSISFHFSPEAGGGGGGKKLEICAAAFEVHFYDLFLQGRGHGPLGPSPGYQSIDNESPK